ncbi:Caffeyl-CoA reductase-Etf complex subunit CarD [Pseudomonas fluorescens]|uniref:Caffeyl-CoA reductase-Etf complex subunit CarD n=1 Tax=Pseudomonas fluorescens TaxID=294 RepID=A0A5E7HTH6_PSEFL|nr:electron transfer flavoprotein subunit beta/FixA family protein [Pseudomonas fluorescens]VVO67335.1 Caffeyl-CoA reductase-Etf complex subunit CarD [Pseudomonas fluorescens]
MHIVVTLKQVFDPNTPPVLLQVAPDEKSIEMRSGMSPVLNGYDANAVEEALKIKESVGGTVTVVTVGDDQAIAQLRRAIAMGADGGIHISGATGLGCDSFVIADQLARAIRKIGNVDLVLSGKASSDTDAGQTHLILAEKLGFASISPVKAIVQVETDALVADRMGEDVTQRLKARLPLLIGISNEINKPRTAGLKGVMMAKKVVIPTWTEADLGELSSAPVVELKRLYIKPPVKVDTVMISEGSDEANGRALADRLVQEGVI